MGRLSPQFPRTGFVEHLLSISTAKSAKVSHDERKKEVVNNRNILIFAGYARPRRIVFGSVGIQVRPVRYLQGEGDTSYVDVEDGDYGMWDAQV